MTKNYYPLVSIVIPVFNGANFMKAAIDSALNQTYKNIEIIVVNDGSNDNGATKEIALSYGNKIRYFEKPNGGVASALNHGMQKMKGEYFSWLSHDDLYEPYKIEFQIELYKNKSVSNDTILFSNYRLINKSGLLIANAELDDAILKFKYLYALYRGCLNGCTLLIPKTILDDIGDFNINLRFTQDYDYWFRASYKYKFFYLPEYLVRTRLHSKQDSIAKKDQAEKEANLLWINMVRNISEQNFKLLEETPLKFYLGMVDFISKTPYREAQKYYELKAKEFQPDPKKELVSVIIPFYNNTVCTINALESVKVQSYDFIEVILVNDGSTQLDDRLINYCKDNSIIIHSLPSNEGPASARNYGMKKAKGEYFAFLDSDDVFVREKLSVQITEMKRYGSYFSHSSYFRVIEDKKTIIDSGKENGFVLAKIIYNCPIATPTVVIHRKIFDDGFLFDPNFKYGEDICAWIEISKKYSLLGIDNPLTIVNVEKNSASQDVFKRTIGLSNIYKFIISDKDLRIFYQEIGLLLNKLSYHKKKYPYSERFLSFLLKFKRIYLLEKILRMALKANH